ncbi:MAG TPA: peptide deformylase, partial [Candidatus Saccharimonadales bacterium]|nr:peptide deformylase [Candidatus Saccharimonadales bacterium]
LKLLPSYEMTQADIERERQERELGIISPSEPLLRRPARHVMPEEINTKRVKHLIRRLYWVAYGQRRNSRQGQQRRTLVGLAAPQIGEALRIVLIDTGVDSSRKKYGRLECFINPEIVWRSRETDEGREGCFSTGQVWGLVRRPIAIKVRAFNTENEQFECILEGFSARIACHEIDHLDGIRFPDRIRSDKKRHWVHTEELNEYPKHVKHWPRVCNRERWDAVRGVTPIR